MIDAQLIIIIVDVLLLAYMYSKYKKGIGQELVIAAIIAFAWVSYSQIYIYKDINYLFLGINLFPFIAWTGGLVFLRERYERATGKNKFRDISICFIISIIIAEYVGYNYFNIQLASSFPGLFGLPLLHAPLFGKIYYLTIGPVYLLITDYLGVK